jgi:NRAMP (natural resistance-associated macrophage protein)-like metal ion transporter
MPPTRRTPPRRRIRRLLAALGPGLVTGAADDDPSGIATYSLAGAKLGTELLWMAWLTLPLMAAVQMTCARIGMVTGRGLMGALRRKFPRRVLAPAVGALLIANTINIGADLSGMADAAELLSGVNSHLWVVLFGGLIGWATIRLRYHDLARVLKWLTLALFAYLATAIFIHPRWGDIARATFLPGLPRGRQAWAMVVAILGTTISPYLFFWQTSLEVEEEKGQGRRTVADREGATRAELFDRSLDVGVGSFFSNLVMFFIILVTALTLHANGVRAPETSREVAEALRPLAGRFAALLYTVGIVGTGLLAIPTLSGSGAYALAELFGWREGVDQHFRGARAFYLIVAGSIAGGVAMDFANLNPVQALYWSAVINGLLAPFLLTGILLIASDATLMNGQPSSRLSRLVVGATTVAMFGAGMAMFLV